MHDAGESKREKRGVLWTLPNAGIPAHDRWNHLPERYCCREITGIDDATDTERPAVGEQFFIRQFRIDGLTVQTSSFRLEKETGVDGFLHRSSSFLQGLPNFTGFKCDDCIFVFHEQSTHIPYDLASGWSRRSRPTWEGGMGCIQSSIYVLFGRERKMAECVLEYCRVD